MQTEVLIIGGGLSGLMAAWQLDQAGVEVLLVEGRNRFGGRVLTVGQASGAHCDLGPSWFWPGQPVIASLLHHFQIPYYNQHAPGTTLLQQADGSIVPIMNTSPMAGSYRIEGGIGRLANALAAAINPARRHLGYTVTGLAHNGQTIVTDCMGPAGAVQVQAKQVALAIPPRLAADLSFSPALPTPVSQTLAATPTWMSGHAKFFAVYERPFWRTKSLCGSAMSHLGPLAEIHDASPHSGTVGCLFGFAGLDAHKRAELGQTEFIRLATQQLAAIFGAEAANPIEVYFQDWSREDFTAATADRQPQTRHPDYGLTLNLNEPWQEKLAFIATETAYSNGGLVEGALASGLAYAQQISKAALPLGDEPAHLHKASMDWDWF
ncbi:MAG: FAD-dependent oxidoreductase [Ardenticatenaceae bacterium]|nr:FAD-dependent oxidoreductase [Ardenticatenaceae bacterium]